MPKKKEATPMVEPCFTAADHTLLNQHLQRYKELSSLHGPEKKEARKRVLNTVQEAVKASHPAMQKVEWDVLKTKIKAWFNLHGRVRQPRTPYVKKSKWNVHRVVGYVKKDEVIEAVAETSGAQPGDRHRFLGNYQPGLSNYVQNLTEDEKAEYQIVADRWNAEGLPDELRQKQADKNSRKWVLEMAEHAWKTFGMRLVLFEGHINGKGENVYSAYDFNSQIGHPAPQPFLDNELDAGTQQQFETDWAHYANEALSADRGRDSGGAIPAKVTRGTTPLIEFERDEYDLPILPPMKPNIKTDEINTMIRSFLVIHYAKLTRKESVQIPWNRISEDQEEFIAPEYLPEVFTLTEPTRKRLADKKHLVEFWLKRQDDPSVRHAFLFKAYASGGEWIHHDYVPKLPSAAEVEQGKKRKKKGQQKSKKQKAKKRKNVAAVKDDIDSEDEMKEPKDVESRDNSNRGRSNSEGGSKSIPTTKHKASAKSSTEQTSKRVYIRPDLEVVRPDGSSPPSSSGRVATSSSDSGSSDDNDHHATKTKSRAISKQSTKQTSRRAERKAYVPDDHNTAAINAIRKVASSSDDDSDSDDGKAMLPTYAAAGKEAHKHANSTKAKARSADMSDEAFAHDMESENGAIVLPREKVKEKAPSKTVKAVSKSSMPGPSTQVIPRTESDSTSTDGSTDSTDSQESDTSGKSRMVTNPSTPRTTKTKRSSTWDLPAPDLTGIPRSRTPTAKRLDMESRPKAQPKKKVAPPSLKGKGKIV